MLRGLKKAAALLLMVGLILGGSPFSHARAHQSAAPASHEHHAVVHYADLAIDPATDECPQAAPSAPQQHDDGLCDKCCTACLGAALLPSAPTNLWAPVPTREAFSTRHAVLTAHVIPIEPGIPKRL